LQAHLANIQPPSLGGKFQSLKSLGGNSVGGSQASSSTGMVIDAVDNSTFLYYFIMI
jgi:hypothetical protein